MPDTIQPIGAKRLAKLPPYLFAELDRKKNEAIQSGKDVIDLGVGDPDLPTPEPIVRRLQQAACEESTHRYPSYNGLSEFRRIIARWFESRYQVRLDPEKEVIVLIGSKEGIGHLPWALLDPGDIALIPDPSYPVYGNSSMLAGGQPRAVPLLKENGYFPDLEALEDTVAEQARVLFLNYPNNPTAATAEETQFQKTVEWARHHQVLLCQDAAYAEVSFDGVSPPSLLTVEGAKDVAVEFHSLSKTFNMTGWRVGFAAGNAQAIDVLAKIKKNIDSGVFNAVQYAAMEALGSYDQFVPAIRETYQARRDIFVNGLLESGWVVEMPRATFYVWAEVPPGLNSTQCAARLLDEVSVSAAPGIGFGPCGEGYVRFSMTAPTDRIEEAVDRIQKMDL